MLTSSVLHSPAEARAVPPLPLFIHQLQRVSVNPANSRLRSRAERVLDEWNDLFARAERILHSLPKVNKPAFFEYVYAPVALVAQANRMYLSGESVTPLEVASAD